MSEKQKKKKQTYNEHYTAMNEHCACTVLSLYFTVLKREAANTIFHFFSKHKPQSLSKGRLIPLVAISLYKCGNISAYNVHGG